MQAAGHGEMVVRPRRLIIPFIDAARGSEQQIVDLPREHQQVFKTILLPAPGDESLESLDGGLPGIDIQGRRPRQGPLKRFTVEGTIRHIHVQGMENIPQ